MESYFYLSGMERILCAAIWYQDGKTYDAQPKNIKSGYVVCGHRHSNVIITHYLLTGLRTRRESSVQGFLTSLNTFVDRVEANKLAITGNQVKDNIEGDELISEDLY